MRVKLGFCERCNREVRLVWTDGPTHEGHAPLGDGPELVCLECGDACGTGPCELTNLSRSVMQGRVAQLEKDYNS